MKSRYLEKSDNAAHVGTDQIDPHFNDLDHIIIFSVQNRSLIGCKINDLLL